MGKRKLALLFFACLALHTSPLFSHGGGGVNEERAQRHSLLNECFVTPPLFSCRKTLSPNEMNVVGPSKVSLAAFISPHKEIFFSYVGKRQLRRTEWGGIKERDEVGGCFHEKWRQNAALLNLFLLYPSRSPHFRGFFFSPFEAESVNSHTERERENASAVDDSAFLSCFHTTDKVFSFPPPFL